MPKPRTLQARERHLILVYSTWEFEMTPQEFYAKWDVSYEQIAQICSRSDSTTRGWFKVGRNRRHPNRNDLRHLALMNFLLEHYEDIPAEIWRWLCLDNSQ